MSTEVVKMSPGQDSGHTTETRSLLSPVAAEVNLPKDNFFLREGERWGFMGKGKNFFLQWWD